MFKAFLSHKLQTLAQLRVHQRDVGGLSHNGVFAFVPTFGRGPVVDDTAEIV